MEAAVMTLFVMVIGLGIIAFWQSRQIARLEIVRNMDLASRVATWNRAIKTDENCAETLRLFGERLDGFDSQFKILSDFLHLYCDRLCPLERVIEAFKQDLGTLSRGMDDLQAQIRNISGRMDNFDTAGVKRLEALESQFNTFSKDCSGNETRFSALQSAIQQREHFDRSQLSLLKNVSQAMAGLAGRVRELERKFVASTTINRLKKFSQKLEATKKAPAKKKPTKGAKAK